MTETRKYSRKSFDRFGDDLCGELLRYLSINDCFAFECVSKQWKRSVFSAQKKLDTKEVGFDRLKVKSENKLQNEIKDKLFECALKKCLFIDEIVIDFNYVINDRTIDIIRENCSHLTSIEFLGNYISVSTKSWQLFIEKFRHSLRSISCIYYESEEDRVELKESMQMLLRCSPNLVECKYFDFNHLNIKPNQSEPLLPKLKNIFAFINEDSDFKAFADNYSDRIKSIILREDSHYYVSDYKIDPMFSQLSRFQSLEILRIETNDVEIQDYIDGGLDLIAKNCLKLRELSIDCNSMIFDFIGHQFVSLKRLTLRCPLSSEDDVQAVKVHHLRCCPNLTSLRILSLVVYSASNSDTYFNSVEYSGHLNSEHLKDIHLYLPHLRCLELDIRERVDENLLTYLSSLKELNYIKFGVTYAHVTDNQLRDFINGSNSVRKIEFNGFVWRPICRRKKK